MAGEVPVTFDSKMVRWIIEGQKTQTRRPFKEPYKENLIIECWEQDIEQKWWGHDSMDRPYGPFFCRMGPVGRVLWVRESYRIVAYEGGLAQVIYKAGPDDQLEWKRPKRKPRQFQPIDRDWIVARFMQKWASRLFLEVLKIRIEKVQEINQDDISLEGFVSEGAFRNYWDSNYEKIGFGWEKNPWVWAVDFEVIPPLNEPA